MIPPAEIFPLTRIVILVVVAFILIILLPSIRVIGPAQVRLITKRFSFNKIVDDNPIAFNGEAGYQADLLMPGWRWKLWVLYKVEKFPWVQVPTGEIGVVMAQVGVPLPNGAKSAVYKNNFENFADLRKFIRYGGQKGVLRPVLSPGTLIPIHPVGLPAITSEQVYGLPVAPELTKLSGRDGILTPQTFGLLPEESEA